MHVIAEALNKHITAFFTEKRRIELEFDQFDGDAVARELFTLHSAIKSVDGDRYGQLVTAYVNLYLARQRIRPMEVGALNNNIFLKAAIRAGILLDITEPDLDNLKGYQVLDLVNQVSTVLNASYETPKK